MRNRGSWTDAKLAYLHIIEMVLQDLKEYWPLTLRQVYYQLVAAGHIENSRSAYQKLSKILTHARIDEKVSWSALEDRARSILHWPIWDGWESYAKEGIDKFLDEHRRDLLQTQEYRLELWVEKDALSNICLRVAYNYCIPVVVARGFSSVSYLYEASKRIDESYYNPPNQKTKILYFGDMDPSGHAMLPAMMETLEDEMGIVGVEAIRCALTEEQIEEHELPHNPDALKFSDPRAQKYVDLFGEVAVELDALSPPILQNIIRQVIHANLDMDAFNAEVETAKEDENKLDYLHEEAEKFLKKIMRKIDE